MKLDKFFTYFWLIIVIMCFILVGVSVFVDAAHANVGNTIGLEWDANTEPTLAGYDIHVSYDCGGPYTIIGTTDNNTTEFWWDEIFPGDNYYFVVTAFNDEGLESGYSNEVCAYVDAEGNIFECGTEKPEDDNGGSGGSDGCFINSL